MRYTYNPKVLETHLHHLLSWSNNILKSVHFCLSPRTHVVQATITLPWILILASYVPCCLASPTLSPTAIRVIFVKIHHVKTFQWLPVAPKINPTILPGLTRSASAVLSSHSASATHCPLLSSSPFPPGLWPTMFSLPATPYSCFLLNLLLSIRGKKTLLG